MNLKELYQEMDTTLEELLGTVRILNAKEKKLSKVETESIQKVQESLLAHLHYCDEQVSTAKRASLAGKEFQYSIQEKVAGIAKIDAFKNRIKAFGQY